MKGAVEKDSMNSKPYIAVSSSSQSSSKRLLFDRRYGWVLDEWKDPSEEALAGGRGMFCVLPIAKSLLNTASHSINLAAGCAVEVYKRPDLHSLQLLRASFSNWLHNFTSSLQRPEFNFHALKGNSLSGSTSYSSHLHFKSRE